MAVTSIWPIKSRIDRVLNYIKNPEKVTESYYTEEEPIHILDGVIEYAADDLKTENRVYVSGVNCDPDSAAKQFLSTVRLKGADSPRLCYHGYQSFRLGEVNAEMAHAIGVETAKKLWGDNKEFTTISGESKERFSALLERLDFNSLWTEERASGLRQLRWHVVTVMETEYPFLRLVGKDVPTEEVRRAFYQLKKEDLEEILADFLADLAAFGSMRQRLFETGRRHELEHGIVLTSNDSWAHEAACQGRGPLKPQEKEDAS